MQVLESLWLSKYIKILEYNKKTPIEVNKLKKKFIDYLEGNISDNLSDELQQFLALFNEDNNEKEHIERKRR